LTFERLGFTAAMLAVLSVASVTYCPAKAEAQATPTQVGSTFKGVIGLGMVGAEVGFIVPAVAGLNETWAFIVFPVIGAAGGAVGGYFALESGCAAGQACVPISVAILSFAMAMVIPTMVITLAATAYDPEDEGTVLPEQEGGAEALDEGDVGGDAATPIDTEEPPPVDTAAPATGLLRWSNDGLALGVPALELTLSQTAQESMRYGGQGQAEVHVPLFSGAF